MFEGNEVKQGLSGKSVLIVGAGVAGLSAAFELEKVGHSTQILELQHRVGGRTKTLRGGFSDGLHAEGGAMRIPPNHYLTNGYIQKFGIPVRPFINSNDNTWLYLDGESKIRTKVDLYKRTIEPISTYSPAFGTSLVEYLRDELGEWWTDRPHTPVDGMDTIAKNFIKPQHTNIENTTDLAKRIKFGANVRCVKKNPENKVEVTARNVMTGTDQIYTADAVIITVPLTILRQMDIDLAEDCRKAIGNIHYQPSTKVVLQCKSRFWEKEVGQGGFSKTNLPIGQLHYPSPNDPRIPNGRGLLVCYTWEQDALIFGSQSETEAVESAVREITKIHPEMKKEFEVGMVQAWFNDNSAQGAYASLLPNQYNSGMKTLMTPDHPIYLAGEAILYTNGRVDTRGHRIWP
ncbi:putative L-amino-acid oxidase YobN [Mytilus edulis]|uniref:putative L-amino-acid oxidase YobN n=1 Tax=Mytilus edulis TaxID=6550 RepID=UPI0039F00111